MKLSLKNIGMITEAELNIDKLTIIAGQNDTGKSTIGKVLFGITNGIINLEKTFKRYKKMAINNNLNEIEKRLISNEKWKSDFIKGNYSYYENMEDIEDMEELEFEDKLFDKIFEIENLENSLFECNEKVFNNFKTYVLKYLKEEDIFKYIEDLNKVIKYSSQDETIQRYAIRQALNLEFGNQINNCFSDEKAEIKLEIDDKVFLELEILNNTNLYVKVLKELFTEDIAYIEGPYMFGEKRNVLFQMNRLNSLKNRNDNLIDKIRKSYRKNEFNFVEMALSEERKQKFEELLNNSMGGVFKYSEKFDSFVLEKNGKEIVMSNIAMGIKSFAILDALLKINFFKQDNILIIDEPETHLHPKWQIEYAKIITNLARAFDTKIIITSHSPYMIEAFQKFTEKEEISKNTNFYLLKKTGNTSKVENVNDSLEKIYSELGSAFRDLDEITLGDL